MRLVLYTGYKRTLKSDSFLMQVSAVSASLEGHRFGRWFAQESLLEE